MTTFHTLSLVAALTIGAALPPAASADTPAQQLADTATVHFAITGMVTDNCPVLVRRAAKTIDGVRSVEASLERKTADIQYDPAKTSEKEIARVIKDLTGLDAKPAK